jgi:coenzyme PQQ precursor peptide PqqA
MRRAVFGNTLGPAWKPALPLRHVVQTYRHSMAGGFIRTRGRVMKWETPQASDQRFGFEITMYISTR